MLGPNITLSFPNINLSADARAKSKVWKIDDVCQIGQGVDFLFLSDVLEYTQG